MPVLRKFAVMLIKSTVECSSFEFNGVRTNQDSEFAFGVAWVLVHLCGCGLYLRSHVPCTDIARATPPCHVMVRLSDALADCRPD